MEAQEVLVGVRDSGGGVNSSGDKLEQQVSSVRESDNLGVELLKDFDSYLEDINDRLMISRMVSDSVIKGMVRAVEQVAEDKIAAKELEVERLKEAMHFYRLGADNSLSSGLPVASQEPRSKENGLHRSFSGALLEHDKMMESLGSLRGVARGQIKQLKKEIDGIKGFSSMRRTRSGSELAGFGGMFQDMASECLVGVVDKTLDSLKTTLDTMCTQVDDMVHLTKESLCKWQQEQEFQREVEAVVIQSSIRSLHEEFVEKIQDHKTCLCGSQIVNWLEKINEVSNLRKELDLILKSLSNPETGQLLSHGSHDMDHFHRNHISSSTSLWEGNGVFEKSKTGKPEDWNASQLKHMKKEELVNYFNNKITEMRRNHESKVQEMTEEYFSLKRDYFKEKGPSLPLRKDKDLDLVRKKIPEVILKLDGILVENEKLSTLSNNAESFGSLKDRLNSLHLEYGQLRDSLLSKSEEVKDAEIEASVTEEVYKCFLREMTQHINCDTKVLEMQSTVMQDIKGISYREASQDAEITSKCEIGESDIDSLIMQGLCGVIFGEAIKDAQSQINDLNTKYLHENENKVSLELKVLKKEEKSRLLIEEIEILKLQVDLLVALLEEKEEEKEKEKEKLALEIEILKLQVDLLVALLEEKEKLALELSDALMKEKEQFDLTSQEINNLKDHASGLQTLVTGTNKKLDLVKDDLAGAREQIEVDKIEIRKLKQKLELTTKELSKAKEQIYMLLAVTQEKQNDILLFEVKENEQRKQMRAVIILAEGLSSALSDFECKAAEGINNNKLRLEESSSQLSSLIQKANILKTTSLLYKQRLDGRCNDLQMAEAEVDLLGDEVDALSNLLEKIYIALDHYSPILQHYPGIIEILKLVKRELRGESIKSV